MKNLDAYYRKFASMQRRERPGRQFALHNKDECCACSPAKIQLTDMQSLCKKYERNIYFCVRMVHASIPIERAFTRERSEIYEYSPFFSSRKCILSENAKIWENFKHILRDKNILLIVMHSFHMSMLRAHHKNQFSY